MPYHYTIDEAAQLVRFRAQAPLVSEDATEAVAALGSDPAVRKCKGSLVDLRGLEQSAMRDVHMYRIASSLDLSSTWNGFRIALVAAAQSVLQQALTLVDLSAALPVDIAVFRDIEDAEVWLQASQG